MHASDNWLQALQSQRTKSEKSWRVTFGLALFLGLLGADRFYLGSPALGVLKLLTAGGFGVWWLTDVILCGSGRMRDSYGRQILRQRLK